MPVGISADSTLKERTASHYEKTKCAETQTKKEHAEIKMLSEQQSCNAKAKVTL